MVRLDRVLVIIAVGSTVAGAALVGWPLDVRGMDGGPVAPIAPGSPVAVVGTDSLAEDIAVANVFGAARTAPRRRYTPPGSDQADSTALSPDTATMAVGPGGTASGVPALFGTLVNADGAQALLQLDTTLGPRLYSTGDRAGGFRVVSIAPRLVVLRGTQGRIVLRLPEEER